MINYGPAIAIPLFIFAALVAAIGFLKWSKYVWEISFVRLIMVGVSAMLSIVISRGISSALSASLIDMVTSMEEVKMLTEALPSFNAIVEVMVTLICTPIIFFVIFSFVKSILNLAAPVLTSFLVKITRSKNIVNFNIESTPISLAPLTEEGEEGEESEGEAPAPVAYTPAQSAYLPDPLTSFLRGKKAYLAKEKSAGGGLIGIISSLAILIMLFSPISGIMDIAADAAEELASSKSEAVDDFRPALETVDAICSNGFTKTTNALGGRAVYTALTTAKLGGNKTTLAKEVDLTVSAVSAVLTITSDATKTEQVEAVHSIDSAFNDSAILPTVISEFITGAASAWERGDAFIGVEAPMPDNDERVEAFIKKVYGAFKDGNADTIKEDFSTIADLVILVIENDVIDAAQNSPETILENTAFIEAALLEIMYNPRLVTVIESAIDLGIDILATTAGVPENLDGKFDTLLTNLAMLNLENKPETAVKSFFGEFGIAITKDSAASLADALIAASAKEGITKLDAKEILLKTPLVITKGGKDITAVIDSEEAFKLYTTLVTAEDIISKNSGDIKDKEHEAKAIADIFGLVESFKELSSGDMNISRVLNLIGDALDKFAATELIGRDCVDAIFAALLQTENISNTIRMNASDAYNFASSLTSNKNKGYREMMESVAKTVDVISNTTAKEDLSADTVIDMLDTLTPEMAEALDQLVNPELMESLGVAEENAEATANILSSTINKLADAKENMTDEEYKKETELITDLVNITLGASSKDSDAPIFGEDGKSGATVSDYVSKITDSEVISGVLIDTVYGEGDEATIDPLGAEIELGEEEKDELVSILNEQYASADPEDEEETKKILTAIGAFVNVDIIITEDGVSYK